MADRRGQSRGRANPEGVVGTLQILHWERSRSCPAASDREQKEKVSGGASGRCTEAHRGEVRFFVEPGFCLFWGEVQGDRAGGEMGP